MPLFTNISVSNYSNISFRYLQSRLCIAVQETCNISCNPSYNLGSQTEYLWAVCQSDSPIALDTGRLPMYSTSNLCTLCLTASRKSTKTHRTGPWLIPSCHWRDGAWARLCACSSCYINFTSFFNSFSVPVQSAHAKTNCTKLNPSESQQFKDLLV